MNEDHFPPPYVRQPVRHPVATAEQRAGYLAAIAFDLADAGIHDRSPREQRAIRRAREERRQRAQATR